MGFVAKGEYVVTIRDRTLVRKADVNDYKLKQIADILGIPEATDPKFISETRSISVYRGEKKSPEQE
jgi:hypothetical protein